jgi:DNA-binding transcriptional MerR regulator
MRSVLGEEFCTPEEVSYLFNVTTRTLNRWAADPDNSPLQARDLAPITQLNGRREYSAEKVVEIYNRTYGKNLTVKDLREALELELAAQDA